MKKNPNSAATSLVASSRLQNHWTEKLLFVTILFTIVLSTWICAQQFASFKMPVADQSQALPKAGQFATTPVLAPNPGNI